MGFCETCEKEYEGTTCPVCGSVMLQELHPEAMLREDAVWHTGGEDFTQEWPKGGDGLPEQAEYLGETSDFGGDCEVMQARLLASGIPSFTQRPYQGQLGKIILGFSGYGVDLYVPGSRLEEAKKILLLSKSAL